MREELRTFRRWKLDEMGICPVVPVRLCAPLSAAPTQREWKGEPFGLIYLTYSESCAIAPTS